MPEVIETRDMYLCLCETPHGKRYWQWAVDPDASIDREDRRREIGPVLVGPEGYSEDEEGASDVMMLQPGTCVLSDPSTWFEGDSE